MGGTHLGKINFSLFIMKKTKFIIPLCILCIIILKFFLLQEYSFRDSRMTFELMHKANSSDLSESQSHEQVGFERELTPEELRQEEVERQEALLAIYNTLDTESTELPKPNILLKEVVLSDPVYEDSIRLEGKASWYGPGFHGRLTANGEKYNQFSLTAAHKSLKFGQVLHVKNKANNKSVLVRINDRGPYVGNRIIDLSEAAMDILGGKKKGVIDIETVTVTNNKGIPYDKNKAFYVQCAKEKTLEKAHVQLNKLHRIGMYEAHIYLLDDFYIVAFGPYNNFKEAQYDRIDFLTLFPLTSIELYSNKLKELD